MQSELYYEKKEVKLGCCPKGWQGHIIAFDDCALEQKDAAWAKMKENLLDLGFVEGAWIEVLHEGPLFKDPIAVRVHGVTTALRRCDADKILVMKSPKI